MSNKKIFLLLFCCVANIIISYAQNCSISIDGYVYDEVSLSPLAYVNIYVQETQDGVTTDDDGRFLLDNFCPGEYHFIISHIGCEDEKLHFDISKDTSLSIALSHTPSALGTVVIIGEKEESNQANLSVARTVIEDNSNQNLSGLLENETGVHLIKNGTGISKPVVHGLFGNRLLILNNGIQQSGQQWGNDHSPEIDPFASDKITVLKGASAIEYGGGNLGSVILTEPKRIEREHHLHGQLNYIFETNGRGHTINARLEKYDEAIAWRVNGTIKKYGDRKTPDYFLKNTGLEETNLSVQLEKSWNDKWFADFYASTFNTQLGILRGAHIGNLTDLESAFTREEPFFTEPEFSYEIDAPRQDVSHHLAKLKTRFLKDEHQTFNLTLAVQINDRKEFDVRRSGRSDIPALSLTQFTFNSALNYQINFDNNWKLKIGNQTVITDNTNDPGTGILPLIPDYISWKSGLFSTLSKTTDKTSIDFGLRYDFEQQTAITISSTLPREIVRFENQFNNIAALFAFKYKITPNQSLIWNIGFATRNPGINELYSVGLHQGVSGIEEGDPNLDIEQALKNTLEYKWVPNSIFAFNLLGYHQRFQNYIYLQAQEEVRLTIRGAFPVFLYEQTDATISGVDVSTQFTVHNSILGVVKYSYVRGTDRERDIPLVFIPPSSFFASLAYRAHQTIHLSKTLELEDTEIEITNRLVLHQQNLLAEQDFLAPPDSYSLLGLKLSTHLHFSKYKLRLFIKSDNLLNASYRDYLNRQRYFADDLGFSFTAGINLKF